VFRLNNLRIGFGLLVATLLVAAPALATVPSDLCLGNPCVVNTNVTIDPGSDLNFGGRSLHFAGGVTVRVGEGVAPRTVIITADNILFQAGARILGDPSGASNNGDRADVTLITTVGSFEMQSVGSTRSAIDVRADAIDAGNITIEAATNAIIGGNLFATAQAEDASGGSIEVIAGGTVTTTQEVSAAAGGVFAGGGEVTFVANGNVTLSAKVSTEGSDFGGGDMAITSTTGKVTIGGLMLLSGGNPDGEAGELDIEAGTDVEILAAAEIRSKGGAGPDEDCGDGGAVLVIAGGSMIVRGPVNLNGGFQCFGGDFDVQAGLDFTQDATGVVSTETAGAFGSAGGVFITAGRNALLRSIDGSSAGFGADIQVTTVSSIEVRDRVTARSTGSEGVGGRIDLTSCSVSVLAPDGELDTRGAFGFSQFGSNFIRASGPMIISGKLQATDTAFTDGVNLLRYKTVLPTVTGPVSPAATIVQDNTLLDCANSCGDGTVTEPEECDDDNIVSCDGCSSSCQLDMICGDGTQECGEQCDDGNDIPGDGCEPDCTPTGQNNEGVLIQGSGKFGCQFEWLLQIGDPAIDKKGEPSSKQECIDGDFECDADGAIDNSCTFVLAPCANVDDEDLAECNPADSINKITIKKPLPGAGNDPANLANAQNMLDSLETFNTTIVADGDTLQSGGPVAGVHVCGPSFEAVIPFDGKSGKRKFKVRTDSVGGKTGSNGTVQLKCLRNDAICGNDETEPGEICDDGNTNSCDGCSSACRLEECGNGTIECAEQCDDGDLNGTSGSRCSNECTREPPAFRIRGSGSKKGDCAMQWSIEMSPASVQNDKDGLPRSLQSCTPGDPSCDLDPAAGCQMDFWTCFGADNPAIACSATAVNFAEVSRPKTNAKTAWELAARQSAQAALAGVTFPAGPGEVCTSGYRVDIPSGETLKIGMKADAAKKDSDVLKISCE